MTGVGLGGVARCLGVREGGLLRFFSCRWDIMNRCAFFSFLSFFHYLFSFWVCRFFWVKNRTVCFVCLGVEVGTDWNDG